MNEIQQYRQNSAKWMGFRLEMTAISGKDTLVPYYFAPDNPNPFRWHPDINHNHMAIMEGKLIEEGYCLEMNICKHNEIHVCHYSVFSAEPEHHEHYQRVDKSRLTAFRLAWIEYYKTINHE